MKVSIVIPNWNGRDMLADCLDSVKSQSLKAGVIVVDNGSSDGSLELLKESYDWVEVIALPNNIGFAGGVNKGIEKALAGGCDYIALLNNDAVADENWLKSLVSAADEHPKAGIITSKIMLIDKKHLDTTGDFMTTWGLPFPRGRNQLDKGQYDKLQIVFGGSGGASLYKSQVFKDVGLFDEDFFAYFEDVDISFRAQLAGWTAWYEPKAIVYHRLGATSGKHGDFARFHSTKNFLMLYAKNMPTKLYFKYLHLFTLQFLRLGLSSLLRGKFLVFAKGVVAAIKLYPKTVSKHRKIQSSKSVSDKYIDQILYHGRAPRPPSLP